MTHVFDGELSEANEWLKAVAARLGGNDVWAKRALRGVLHALRDRIGHENAVKFSAQLPTLVRGLFFEGWRLSEPPSKERRRLDFLVRVDEAMGVGEGPDPKAAVEAVFHVLWAEMDPGEIAKLRHLLPAEIAALWPAAPDDVDRATHHRARIRS